MVTGANGLVGAAVCRALAARSASVRAVVRRPGTAPSLDGVTEHVGDAADVLEGADAVVTTVHPMGSSREVQHEVGVEGTAALARAAAAASVARLVHVSTAGSTTAPRAWATWRRTPRCCPTAAATTPTRRTPPTPRWRRWVA
ncbi:NAD(P)H-binding protein [Klenkia terrae]|uniref:NAD(P)H-binding protein n=1 Tax=Klenkia terrae TaxID=1052259 RepID=UPI003614E592